MVALSLLITESTPSAEGSRDPNVLVQRAITHRYGIPNRLFMWGDPPPISEESYGGKLPFAMVDNELASVMPKNPGDIFIVGGEDLLAIEVHPGKSVVAVPCSSIQFDTTLLR